MKALAVLQAIFLPKVLSIVSDSQSTTCHSYSCIGPHDQPLDQNACAATQYAGLMFASPNYKFAADPCPVGQSCPFELLESG